MQRVQECINKFDINLKILVLNNSARTAKEASAVLKCDVGAIVKSLLFKVNSTFLICLVAGDNTCSLKKLKNILNEKNIQMANANEVKINTGFSIGGVPPVAHIKKLKIIIDNSLSKFRNVFAAAGHSNCIFKIKYSQLVNLTKGSEREISE